MKRLISLVCFLVVLPFPVLGVHNLLINGSSSATVTTEDTITIDGLFEVPGAVAEIYMLDDWTPSYPIIFRGRAIDGDYDDEDETANGVYQAIETSFTMTGQYFIIAEDNGVADTVWLTITPIASSYSISGTLTIPPSQPHIMVMAYWNDTLSHRSYNYGDLTDDLGNYTISIPDEIGNRWWQIMIYDMANAAPYYIGGFDSVNVTGNVSKDLAMFSSLPDTCRIYGTIKDEFGNSLNGPSRLTGVGLGTAFLGIRPGLSDNFGAYNLYFPGDAIFSYYNVSLDIFEQFRPEFMNPVGTDTMVFGMIPPFQILLNLKVYQAANIITGNVYKDGLAYDDAQLWAENDTIGNAYCRSFSDGHYSMPVSDSANSYDIGVSDETVPPGYYVVEGTQTVPPGATNIDFHLEPLAVSENKNGSIETNQLTVFPNPSSEKVNIRFMIQDTGYRIPKNQMQDAGSNPSATLGTGKQDFALKIYDAAGRLVKSFNLESCIMNHVSIISWEGNDNSGRKLPAGVYFVRLETGDYKKVEKAVLLR